MTSTYRENLLYIARHYALQGDWKRALREFERLKQIFPDDAEVLETLALCYRELGQEQKAQCMLREALMVC
jgi:Flp pilus assembly protein TadD